MQQLRCKICAGNSQSTFLVLNDLLQTGIPSDFERPLVVDLLQLNSPRCYLPHHCSAHLHALRCFVPPQCSPVLHSVAQQCLADFVRSVGVGFLGEGHLVPAGSTIRSQRYTVPVQPQTIIPRVARLFGFTVGYVPMLHSPRGWVN